MVIMENAEGEKEAQSIKAEVAPEPRFIEVPDGVEVNVSNDMVVVKGALGTNTRKFNDRLFSVSKEGNKIVIKITEEKSLRKKANSSVNAFAKELINDMKGVKSYFEKRMETVFLHFPIALEVKGNMLIIKNIFGERKPRSAKIVGTAKVEIKDKDLRIYGTKLDDVSQTAANIRLACKVKDKDVRVFQDGLYYAVE